jgi:hypothetical protein
VTLTSFKRYTGLTTSGANFSVIRFIHLRLLRERPFWAGGFRFDLRLSSSGSDGCVDPLT